MFQFLLPALLFLATPQTPETETVTVPETEPAATAQAPAGPASPATPTATPAPSAAADNSTQDLKSLSFLSQKFPFQWDRIIPLNLDLDGLKINSIFFDKRTIRFIRTAEFGTRAQVEASNTSRTKRVPGFAVAVFDADNRLLGVATGGPTFGGMASGNTETFDMSFKNVVDRIPKGAYFYLSVELSN